jgi:ATP phosphoribosyltransferase regulatory subunit HisZ
VCLVECSGEEAVLFWQGALGADAEVEADLLALLRSLRLEELSTKLARKGMATVNDVRAILNVCGTPEQAAASLHLNLGQKAKFVALCSSLQVSDLSLISLVAASRSASLASVSSNTVSWLPLDALSLPLALL